MRAVRLANPKSITISAIYLRPDDGWRVTHRNSRVIDPQENRDENPWEWRSDEFTLSQCKGKCNEFPDTCTGIEFETYDGTSDCIMLRGEERTVNNAPGCERQPLARSR